MDQKAVSGDYTRFSQLAYVLVRDPVTAEVIAVESVLAAVRRSASPDAPPGLHRAKRKLARHAMSYIRRRRLLGWLPWKKRAADNLDLAESTRSVWHAVAGLTPRQQVAVVMARLEGATLIEIADALDCSNPAAASYLEKGRKSLVERLGSDADLRTLLTRELRNVAQAYVRVHRPDPRPVERAMARSGRWKAAGFALAVVGVGAVAVVLNALRG